MVELNRCRTLQFKGFDIDDMLKKYNEFYDALYEGGDRQVGYEALVTIGDCYLKVYPEVVRDFVLRRNDVLSSDREVAAFALTMESMGALIYIEEKES